MSGLLPPDPPIGPASFRSGATTPSGRGGELPEDAAARRAQDLADTEQQRSERNRIAAIQTQLAQDTTLRRRGYGLSSLFGQLRSSLGTG